MWLIHFLKKKKLLIIYTLIINHLEVLDFGKSTFYRYINNGVFEFGPLDFPRIVKQKEKRKTWNDCKWKCGSRII